MDKLSPDEKLKKILNDLSSQRRVALRATKAAPIHEDGSPADKLMIVAAIVVHFNELTRHITVLYSINKNTHTRDQLSVGGPAVNPLEDLPKSKTTVSNASR